MSMNPVRNAVFDSYLMQYILKDLFASPSVRNNSNQKPEQAIFCMIA